MSKLVRRMSKLVGVGMMAAGLMVGVARKAHAYSDALNSNNTAQITITITPNVDRSVTIDTGNVNMNLGAVSLGPLGSIVSTQTVSPATVTVQGTISNTDLLLSANIAGGWSFSADSTSVVTDSLATWVTLTGISTATAPTQDDVYFNGTTAGTASDLVSGTYVRVGTDSTTPHGSFENGVDSNRLPGGTTKRHLWTFFRMPSETTTSADQKITFILTVDQGL